MLEINNIFGFENQMIYLYIMSINKLIEGRWYHDQERLDMPIVEFKEMINEMRARYVVVGSESNEEGESDYINLKEIYVLPRYFEKLANLKESTDLNDIVYIKGHYFFGFESNNPASDCYVYELIPGTTKLDNLGKVQFISELQGLIEFKYLGGNREIVEVIRNK